MAEENAERFREVLDTEDHRALFDICYQGELDSCPPDTLQELLDFGWRRFLHLSGLGELGPLLSPSAASELPDVLLRWVWQNRWILAWDYSNDLINWFNVIEALLYGMGSRCGQPIPTAYSPMPFLDKAARERQRGQYEAYYVCPDWVTRLGIEVYDFSRERSELHKRLGHEPVDSQVVAALLDERITQARSFHILSALYHEKALFLHWSGEDCLPELQEAARMRLLSYQSDGIVDVLVFTCLGQFKCDSTVGYCRCHYFPGFPLR